MRFFSEGTITANEQLSTRYFAVVDIYIDIYVQCVYIRTELYYDNHTTKTGQNWIPNSWTHVLRKIIGLLQIMIWFPQPCLKVDFFNNVKECKNIQKEYVMLTTRR